VSIDIPRVTPINTPAAASAEEDVRVRQTPREERIPADLGHPVVDRRYLPERRRRRESRPPGLELRSHRDRRAEHSIDLRT